MQTHPLPPKKIVFNCNVLIIRTMQRTDLKTSEKGQIWHKLRQIKQQYK